MSLYNTVFHKNIENDEIPLKYIKETISQIKYIGYEFSEDVIKNAVCDNIIQTDLTMNLEQIKDIKYTYGLCLEVLEHIEDKYWKEVLTNITKLYDIIIFSAAHPGQGETGHNMTNGYHMSWLRMNAIILVKA